MLCEERKKDLFTFLLPFLPPSLPLSLSAFRGVHVSEDRDPTLEVQTWMVAITLSLEASPHSNLC